MAVIAKEETVLHKHHAIRPRREPRVVREKLVRKDQQRWRLCHRYTEMGSLLVSDNRDRERLLDDERELLCEESEGILGKPLSVNSRAPSSVPRALKWLEDVTCAGAHVGIS